MRLGGAGRETEEDPSGRSVGSWVEGTTSVTDALTPEVRREVDETADLVDPNHVIARWRFLN